MNYRDIWERHPSKSQIVSWIRDWFLQDEFRIIIVEGLQGYGKSSFASFVASEIYNTWDWSYLKNYIVFHPRDFLKRVSRIRKKHPFMVWDDAGYWLNSMDYNNRFVKAVGKYMQVARLDWGCIMFTSIHAKDVITKIKGAEGRLKVKITKMGAGLKKDKDRRTATIYEHWESVDGSQFGEEGKHDETFYARMPDSFYNGYFPYRKGFTMQAKKSMRKSIDEILE